ncbi:acetyl-CoA carboxylase carboxyl transferase subunit alpha, partial [Francisella tularensis subsp. holarctica]|nr:acetyl-CoA carboxylase carboxyl transferase subunit alpha [Francisella tularensis subsp. holarctica]
MNYLDFESKIKENEDKITSLSHVFEDEKTEAEIKKLSKKRLELMES